jgi:hypothetical protein
MSGSSLVAFPRRAPANIHVIDEIDTERPHHRPTLEITRGGEDG